MFKTVVIIALLSLLIVPNAALCVNYYVSPTGNDDADGLTESTAWATIDNGDQKEILMPGDTVNILAGTYMISAKIDLKTNGLIDAPIVYQNYGGEKVILDAASNGLVIIESNANHVIIKGLELMNTTDQGIHVKGDSTKIIGCYVHDTGKEGYRNEGKYTLFLRNIAAFCSEEGFKNEGGGDFAIYHHNVAYSCGKMGFELKSDDSRIINSIIVLNDKGIKGNDKNICAFNDVWGNTTADYDGGVVDSAGGISSDPRFISPDNGNFKLQGNSPAIDTGMYLGYSFLGEAPDLGAMEFMQMNLPPKIDNVASKSVYEGQNLNFDIGASDPNGTIPALSATYLPANASFVDNGDGTGTFDFNPDFTQAGVYEILFIASDGELADSEYVDVTVISDPVSYIVVSPDSAVVSADSTLQFTVEGFNSVSEPCDPGTVTWELTENLGSIDNSGLFDAGSVGTARVVAISDHGPVDTSAYLEVVYGELDSLEIQPDIDTISTDSTVQFTAVGYDKDDNVVTETGALTWEVMRDIGTISPAGLFDPINVKYGYIKVTSDLGPQAITDTIYVIPGSPKFIEVLPEENLAEQGASIQYSAKIYDADSNYITDTTSFANWSTTDPSGSITGDGFYTAGNDPSPPVYYVTADLDAMHDSGQVTVISDGALAYIKIEWLDGTPVGDTALTTDDDSLKVYCRGYDSGDNPLGNVSVTWNLESAEPIGDLLDNSTYYTRLNLDKPGSGRIVARYSNDIADTTGLISCQPGAAADLVISPDTATVTADSAIAFSVDAYDTDGNITDPVIVDSWEVIGGIGTINGSGEFEADSVGTGQIICNSGALIDTSGTITVVAGILHSLDISPDSLELTLGSIDTFEVTGTDEDGNITETGNLMWEVIEDIGTIDSSGVFTATAEGTGRIEVTSEINGVTDTNDIVTVLPASLEMIVVMPDTASLMISESIQFTASGFDAGFDPINTGDLSWEVIGDAGSIDSEGNFVAASKGICKVAVTSSINAVTDTTNLIVVEVPTITEIPLGNQSLKPNQSLSPVLAFRISNAFEETKYLEEIRVRSACAGSGNAAQLLSNIESISVYHDLNDDGALNANDLNVGMTSEIGEEISVVLDPIAVPQASSRTFFVSIKSSLYPHDGDSLDFYLLTASDLDFTDGTVLAGPDSINSLGYCIIDGMVADQVQIIPSGNHTANPGAGIVRCLTLDLPRNGYEGDTINIISVFNAGSATSSDIDSFLLFTDDGNGSWDNSATEIYQGNMTFTGQYWSISGINVPLTQLNTRFYLCAALSDYPSDGAAIALGIPKKGIEMASDNDGPLDNPVNPIDTITVLSTEALTVKSIELSAADIYPGGYSMPITAIRINNGTSSEIGLDSMRVSLFAEDPDGASQSELNSQIDSVILWLNRDGDFATLSSSDSIIDQAVLSGEYAVLKTDDIALAAGGGSAELFITTVLDSYLSKNGNSINFGLNESSHLYLDQAVEIAGIFPIKNQEDHIINAFPAAAIDVNAIPGKNLFGGQKNQIMLDFSLPGDGYVDAEINSLKIINIGTTNSSQALDVVKLWEDVDLNGFSANDIFLGELNYYNGYWRISNLGHSFSRSSNRFLITADIANAEFAGGTLRFGIPINGVEFLGGVLGPDDVSIENPESHFLLPANRVTAISIPQEALVVRPGANYVPILTFALYNGYLENEHTLKSIRFTNTSISISDDDYADYELGQVSLYYDKNGNRDFDGDSLLAAGYLSDGTLTLNGIDAGLPPEELSYFFVLADLPLNLIDDDTLAVSIESTSDFAFEQTVNLNGDLPLMRGGKVVVDGSVNSQYQLYSIPNRTLSPGDSSVCLFAFRPALNGNLNDLLQEITIENQADAGHSEIESLELWIDGNDDGLYQENDFYQGDFVFSDSKWIYTGTELEINESSPAIFVVGNISGTAITGRSIQIGMPINGCQYASGNDGPIDAPVIAQQVFVISASELRISFEGLNPEYTVGESFCTKVNVTNLTIDSITGVNCEIDLVDDNGIVTLDSSFIGQVSIAPGEIEEFYRCYTASAAGNVRWLMRAYSSAQPESTEVLVSDTVRIQSIPQDLKINLISSIPASVIKGQTHVYPMSLSYSYPETGDNSAPIRLDSLRVQLTDGSGNTRLASETFSRIVLSSGYSSLAVLEDLPSESSILIEFNEPDVLYPGEKRILSLMVDIDSSAEVGEFLLKIEESDDIAFVEYNTGLPITLDETVLFPLETASCRIDNPSQFMAVSYVPALGDYINYGQDDINFMDLILRHPGEPQSSQIQLTGISFEFINGPDENMPAADFLEEIKILRQNMVIGFINSFGQMDDSVWIQLNAPPVLSPGETDTISIRGSVLENIALGEIGLRINDSTAFTFRDVSSGLRLSAISDKDTLSAEEIFPMVSGIAGFKHAAGDVEICINPMLPPSVVGGADTVSLFDISFAYLVPEQYSSVKISSFEISVLDTLERALDPSLIFHHIGYIPPDGPADYQSYVQLREGRAVFDFSPDEVVLNPGDEHSLSLIADLETDVPYDHFKLVIQGWDYIDVYDATDTANRPGYRTISSCQNSFPSSTEASQIFLPANEPIIHIGQMPAQIGYPGQTGITIFSADIEYDRQSFVGDLVLESLHGEILKRTQTGLERIQGINIFDQISLYVDDILIASDSQLADGFLDLEIISDFVISRDNEYELKLVSSISPEANLGNYALRFSDSTFLSFVDKNLGNEIVAVIENEDYPIVSADISLSQASLEESFTNYPNPFNPNMDEFTRIAFALDRDASVDIEIFTITGELIKVLAENSQRSAGTYIDDKWYGYNDLNLMVIPGTYFCRITAHYESGRTETFRRKIAVIR